MADPLSYEPLELSGAPRQRGRAHGEALRPLIHALFAAWEQEVQAEVGLSLPAYLERFRRDVDFLPALERWVPELLEEVQGIAEGANLPLEDCRCLQLLDEHWHHLGQLQREREQEREQPATCSVVGGGQPPCLGQNMDLPKYLDGFQTLLRLRDPDAGLELLVPSFAGLIGLYGLSNSGFALCVNTISQLRCSPTGLPVAYVVRGALGRASPQDARDFLARVPHASGQSYVVGARSGLVNLECSAGGAVRHPTAAAAGTATVGAICHTNHPLASDDLRDEAVNWDADRARADQAHGLTFTRLERLERSVKAEPLTVAHAKRLLEEVVHPPDSPFDVFTFSSAVFELHPPLRAHVASGPAGTPYRTYSL